MQLYREEEIKFWRTADQKEVDFVVNTPIDDPFALEVKFGSGNLNLKKYNKFTGAYPDIPLGFIVYGTSDIEKTTSVLKF